MLFSNTGRGGLPATRELSVPVVSRAKRIARNITTTANANTREAVENYNVAVREWNEDIIFLRKIVEGGADKSYGIHVARLAGIPVEVIDRAREILGNLENQALDLDDRPALARSSAKPKAGEGRKAESIQLDFFQSINDEIYREQGCVPSK